MTKRGNPRKRKRFRRGKPLFEGRDPFRFITTAEDIACAIPRDREHCVLGQTLHRMFGAEAFIEVYRNVAYVFIVDHYERYMVPAHVARAIDHFDKTGEWTLTDVTLLPPSPGRTLDAREAARGTRTARGPNTNRAVPSSRVVVRGSNAHQQQHAA